MFLRGAPRRAAAAGVLLRQTRTLVRPLTATTCSRVAAAPARALAVPGDKALAGHLPHNPKRGRKLLERPAPPPSPEEAVNNILYNTPTSSRLAVTRHVLNILVSNEPGVLSRIAGVVAARGFNIDSLAVAKTDVPDLSRMTVVLTGAPAVVEQAKRQLEDLVPVWAVLDYTHARVVERELLLVKVSSVPVEHLMSDEAVDRQGELLSPLAMSSMQRQSLKELAELFNARVVDVMPESLIIELCAKPDKVEAFLRNLKPYGIIEATRSGAMAMPRAPIDIDDEDALDMQDTAESSVDATMLPPG